MRKEEKGDYWSEMTGSYFSKKKRAEVGGKRVTVQKKSKN